MMKVRSRGNRSLGDGLRKSIREVKRIWGPRVGEEGKEVATEAQSRDSRMGKGQQDSTRGRREEERKDWAPGRGLAERRSGVASSQA